LEDSLLVAFKGVQRASEVPDVPEIDGVIKPPCSEEIFTERIERETIDFFPFVSSCDLMDGGVVITRVPEKDERVVTNRAKHVRVMLMPRHIFYHITVTTILSHRIYIQRGFTNIPETDNIVIRAREELSRNMRVPGETITFSSVTMTTVLGTTDIVPRDRVMFGIVEDEDSRGRGFCCDNELNENETERKSSGEERPYSGASHVHDSLLPRGGF
jgi:hypothetical protein